MFVKSTISDEQLRKELRWSFGERARLLQELAHIRRDTVELQNKRDNTLQRGAAVARLMDELLTLASARRRASDAVPPLPEKAELREFGGLKLAFPNTEGIVDSLADDLRHANAFPAKHMQLMALGLIGRGGTMIDVGANIGLTTIPPLLLDLVDSVIAVEPASLILPFLKWNLAANGLSERVTVVPAVMGDAEGAIEFSLSGATGLHHIKGADASDTVATETVRQVVLDGLVRSFSLAETPPRFVKIDTQGAEVRVLRGARDLLARRASVFEVEFWPHGIEALGDNPGEALDCLQTYFSWFLDEKSLPVALKPISSLREAMNALEPGKHTDLLLLP